MDIKCPSSGMTDKMIWENLDHLSSRDEVKFVIKDRMDFDWAKDIIEKYRLAEKVRLLFSPVFHELEPQQLAEWILEQSLPVRMQLQIHKYIWSPETRGV
jgi:7-carboxy-7-deazaguanine synthase